MSFSDDLENWMTFMPESIRRNVPLINLAIPGSHDSFSYGISRKSRLAPDAEEIVQKLFPFVPCVIRRWSKTQNYTVEDQLKNGIRYFDLRVASNVAEQNIYFVHALFCEEISEPFRHLLKFLEEHPKEFVILDFQHFYQFEARHHQRMIQIVMKMFKLKLFERALDESNLNQLTLTNAYETSKQILIIYRNDSFAPSEFFRSYDFPTPWPRATKIESLKEFLDKRLEQRSPNQGFVTQCVLTPDANFIVPRFYSTLRKKCAKKVDAKMTDWIMQQTPGEFKDGGQPTPNVFLADFVDIRDNNFSRIVVDLNMKLEDETKRMILTNGLKE